MTNADRVAVVNALSEYLHRNPEACDTLDGIANWWLGGEWSQRTDLVQDALDELEEIGVIERIHASDGRIRYRRRRPDRGVH